MPDAFLIIPSPTRNDPPATGVRSSDLVPCFKSDISTKITLIPLHANSHVGMFVRSLPSSFPTGNPVGILQYSNIITRFGRSASTIAWQSLKAFNQFADIKSQNTTYAQQDQLQHGRKEAFPSRCLVQDCLRPRLFVRESRNTAHHHRSQIPIVALCMFGFHNEDPRKATQPIQAQL